MSEKTDNLINLVKPYGLSDEEASIYIYLLRHGFVTALALSTELKIARTKIYRLLDKLKERQLLETKIDERGMKFGATHPQKFQQLVADQEQHIAALKNSLPDVVHQLKLLSLAQNSQQANSKVLYYEGIEGLKQVSYNITRAKEVLRVFEMQHLSDFLPKAFSEMVRKELVGNKVKTLDLTNKTNFGGFTEVSELIQKYSEFRYIAPEKLKINFEVLIYNDVYATYTYQQEKIFCVEIYNEQLAAMQKQLFDFVWEQSEVMEFSDERGAARVKK